MTVHIFSLQSNGYRNSDRQSDRQKQLSISEKQWNSIVFLKNYCFSFQADLWHLNTVYDGMYISMVFFSDQKFVTQIYQNKFWGHNLLQSCKMYIHDLHISILLIKNYFVDWFCLKNFFSPKYLFGQSICKIGPNFCEILANFVMNTNQWNTNHEIASDLIISGV